MLMVARRLIREEGIGFIISVRLGRLWCQWERKKHYKHNRDYSFREKGLMSAKCNVFDVWVNNLKPK